MKLLKTFRIFFCILLALNIFILGCGKKSASEPAAEGPSITSDEDTKVTAILGETIKTSDLIGFSPESISAATFTEIKNRIDARGDFLFNSYYLYSGTYYAKNLYYFLNVLYKTQAEFDLMEKQRIGIMKEIGFPGLYSQVFLGSYAYYVNRTGTLTFNSDNTMTYSSVSAHLIFNSGNFTGMLKEDSMSPQSASGTYSTVQNDLTDITGTPTGEKENMLHWIGNTDADQVLLPNRTFKVIIISDKNILMTYPFVKDGAAPKPLSISIAALNPPANLADSKAKLLGKWNYLNTGSIEFADDGSKKTWSYSTLGAVSDSGDWDVIEVGGTYYLKLLYLQTRTYNEQTGGSELKSYTNPRWVIVEYYVDDNYFAMNIYRRKTAETIKPLEGTWEHSNYDYMDNYWTYSFYPVSLTETQLNGYKDQINAKNTDDKALLENCYNTGDPRTKKIVKGSKRTYIQPKKPNKLPIFDKMMP